VFYSTDDKSGILGMSIFKVCIEVREYITHKLANLSMLSVSIEVKGG